MSAEECPSPVADTGPAQHDRREVELVARGIATAVAPPDGLTAVQAALLQAIASALTGVEIDYHGLDPLAPEELALALQERDLEYRQRIVHHMVLGELVLRPIPTEVAFRVARYAHALGVADDFVRIARRYAQGAYGLAWIDLRRNGFIEHVQQADEGSHRALPAHPFEESRVDADLLDRWKAFAELPGDSLGRAVWELYESRGFVLPGAPGAAPEYLAQHDFVHVLADYGTNLKGELEVFAFIGRADPDPKGFAWLATLIGLFETGYIESTGFFDRDVRERNIQASGMPQRLADAMRRGKIMAEGCATDLFEVDYHALASRPRAEACEILGIPPKSTVAVERGSAGAFDREGMSDLQRRVADQRAGGHR